MDDAYRQTLHQLVLRNLGLGQMGDLGQPLPLIVTKSHLVKPTGNDNSSKHKPPPHL